MEEDAVRQRIEQPKGTKLCGQIAVAVIAEIPLGLAIAHVGHSKGTSTHTLVHTLRKLGFDCPDRPRRMMNPPPLGLAIMRPTWKRGGTWHWVVIEDGRIIDGADVHLRPDYRVTSYLPVFEP